MDFFLIVLVCGLTGLLLKERATVVYSATKDLLSGIAAPSPSTLVVPSYLNNTVPASTVLITEGSCPVSDFTSTLWFCPSATATATATATTITTSTSTQIFSPIETPGPVTMETLAPGLLFSASLCIAALVVFIATLLVQYAYHLGQVKGAQHPIAPAEAPLSCSESIVTSTYYDWHNSDSLGSAGQFAGQEDLFDIAWTKWHDDYMLQRIDKLESNARERDLQAEIRDINAARDDRESILRNEIAAINSARNDREGIHQKEIAAKKRSHQYEIEDIKAKHKKELAVATADANNQRRKLGEEAKKRKAAEDKLEALDKAGMLTFDLPKPTAQTSPQDGAPDSTPDLLLPVPVATEGLTTEAEEPLPSEPASLITTPELDSAEPTAETSPQDVAPGTKDQLPSPPAATEGSIAEPEEAFPVAIPSPIAEAEDELPAETEGLSEAESTNSTEHEQEQEEEKVEEEPRNSGTPLPEPSLMGKGAAQIPQDQEKGLAQDAPVPTQEPVATSQLTEPEAAPGPATSDDGASEAPVTKEVLPEEQTGDRETKEPTAVEESEEVRGATPSDDGASMTPVTKENGNGLEMTTAEQSDQPPPVSIDQAVPGEAAEGMDLAEDSPTVASILEWQSAAANGSESFEEAGASESLTSLSPPNATIVEHDDEMSDRLPDETKSPHDMDVDEGDGTVNHSGTEQSNSAGETAMDLSGQSQPTDGYDLASDVAKAANGELIDLGGIVFGDDSTNETQVGHVDPANEAQHGSGMVVDSPDVGASGLGCQSNDVTMETAPPLHQTLGDDQGLPSQLNNVAPTENLSGPSTLQHPPQWRGTIEWDTSRPPTFPRPFKISQPAHQPLSTPLLPESSTPQAQSKPPASVVRSTQHVPPQQPVSQIGNPLPPNTHPQPPAPVVQKTQQVSSQQPASQTVDPLLLATHPQPPAPVVQSTQQAPPQQPVPQIGNSLTPNTHPQPLAPVVQSAQQLLSQQPVSQTANPLYAFEKPSDAASEIKRWIPFNPDLRTVVQQMAWAADYMENRKSVSKANHILRSCVEIIGPMHRFYKEQHIATGHPVFESLVEDINRVYDQLREIK